MKNIELFNHYAVSIVGVLYEVFPCYKPLELDELAQPLAHFPPAPFAFSSWTGVPKVYIGPDICGEWGIDPEYAKRTLEQYDWESAREEAEKALKRRLTDSEFRSLRNGDGRPLTDEEQSALADWSGTCAEIQAGQNSVNLERYVLKETIKFLLHENIIRSHAIAKRLAFAEEPIDILIDTRYQSLKFCLTSAGCARMLRRDPLSRAGEPISKRVLAYVGDKTVDAAAGCAAGLLSPLLFGF
jgi:hypothetical protein